MVEGAELGVGGGDGEARGKVESGFVVVAARRGSRKGMGVVACFVSVGEDAMIDMAALGLFGALSSLLGSCCRVWEVSGSTSWTSVVGNVMRYPFALAISRCLRRASILVLYAGAGAGADAVEMRAVSIELGLLVGLSDWCVRLKSWAALVVGLMALVDFVGLV